MPPFTVSGRPSTEGVNWSPRSERFCHQETQTLLQHPPPVLMKGWGGGGWRAGLSQSGNYQPRGIKDLSRAGSAQWGWREGSRGPSTVLKASALESGAPLQGSLLAQPAISHGIRSAPLPRADSVPALLRPSAWALAQLGIQREMGENLSPQPHCRNQSGS